MFKSLKFVLPGIAFIAGFFGWTQYADMGPQHYQAHEESEEAKSHGEIGKGISGAIAYYDLVRNNHYTGITTPEDRKQALSAIDEMKKDGQAKSKTRANGFSWEFMGPDNVGGRTRDMIVDKDDNNLLVVGSVSGGIYRSTNRGRSWRPIREELENNAIVALEQTGDGTMFLGTGEANFTYLGGGKSSGFAGQGVWRSTDKGVSWEKVIGPSVVNGQDRWTNTNELAADHTAQNRIFAGTDNGLMLSEDNGETWDEVFKPGPGTGGGRICLDVNVSSDGQDVYAVFLAQVGSETCQIYRSQNRGAAGTWERVGETDVSENVNRIEIGIAPSNKNFVYVAASYNSTGRDNRNRLEGFYQSTDGGDTWNRLIRTDPYTFYPFSNFGLAIGGQGWYDNTVSVDPYDPEKVYLAGVHFYRWSQENGWFRLAGTQRVRNSSPDNEFYVHADKHNVIFDTASKPYRLYVLSDGGVGFSDDAQISEKPTFKVLNNGYGTIQLYSVSASTKPPYKIVGGAQDNGTQRVEPNSLSGKSSVEILGGDGFGTEISRYAPKETWFTSLYYARVNRSFEEGDNPSQFFDDNIRPEGRTGNLGPFNTTFRLWEGVDTLTVDEYIYDEDNPENSRVVEKQEINYRSLFVLGTYYGIYATPDATNEQASPTWYRIANVLSSRGQQVLDFSFSKDGNHLYVAGGSNSSGKVYRISGLRDARLKYDGNRFNPGEAGITVTQIDSRTGVTATGVEVDDNNPDRVVVTYGNYDQSDHVFITENGTSGNPQFSSLQNNLPPFPVYDVQISNSNSDEILLGTEFGIFTSLDGGQSWEESNVNLPRIPVFELRQYMLTRFENGVKYREGPYFYAGTHARGVFRAESNKLLLSEEEPLKQPKPDVAQLDLYPNPAQDFVRFDLGSTDIMADESTEAILYNLQGQEVKREVFNADMTGTMELQVSNLPQGQYLLKVSQGDNVFNGRVIKE